MIAPALKQQLEEEGYVGLRLVPGRGVCGIRALITTYGIFCGLDETGYLYRYCYQYLRDAGPALRAWSGEGDPPGPWIVLKGQGEDRLGPGATS
jgi:hypothetical protein